MPVASPEERTSGPCSGRPILAVGRSPYIHGAADSAGQPCVQSHSVQQRARKSAAFPSSDSLTAMSPPMEYEGYLHSVCTSHSTSVTCHQSLETLKHTTAVFLRDRT